MQMAEMKLGKSLEIFVLRGDYRFRLVSKIEDVKNGRVCVTQIATRNRLFQFYDTDEISFIYRNENRLWKWNHVIPGTTELDGYQLHCFYSDKEGETYNRRNAYRVFIGEEITLHYIPSRERVLLAGKSVQSEEQEETKEAEPEEMVCDGFLKDLSENGAGIFSDERFSLKDEISFTVYTDMGMYQCRAEIVRISPENHGIYKRYYGCSFIQTDKDLIRFLYQRQRQYLRNAREEERRG